MVCSSRVFAGHQKCSADLAGHRVLPGSVHEYLMDGIKECFFAYYEKNEDMTLDARGGGNPGNAIWYAHNKPDQIPIAFPKPRSRVGLQSWVWQSICNIDAVSFIDIDGDGHRDVTVIGTCLKSGYSYRHYFVFLRNNDSYVLREDVLFGLLGQNDLDIADIRDYVQYEKAHNRK